MTVPGRRSAARMPADGFPRAHRNFLLGSALLLLGLGTLTTSLPILLLGLNWIVVYALARASARSGLASLEIARSLRPGAFEDEEVEVRLELRNLGRRAARWIEVTDSFGASLGIHRTVREPGPLPGRHRRRLGYRTCVSQLWGTYLVGPLEIARTDSLGLHRASRCVLDVVPFSVFPRVHTVPGLGRLGARPSQVNQETTVGERGRSDLYLGVREFVTGDDPRRIHWPATARHGRPMLRELELDRVPWFTLFLDLSQAHRAGLGRKSTLEYVVRTAASLLASAAREGHWVQVFTNRAAGTLIPPGRGMAHVEVALEALITVKQDARSPLVEVALESAAVLPRGSVAALLLATATLDGAALAPLLQALQAREVSPLFLFVDHTSFVPIDRRPAGRGWVRGRRASLERFLAEGGVRHAFLEEVDDIEACLAAGLFGDAGTLPPGETGRLHGVGEPP